MFIKSKQILDRLVGEGNWTTMVGSDYNTIVVKGGVILPTEEEFNAIKAAVELEYDTLEYKQLRVAEYPSIGDQLDALWKGGAAADEMLARVQAVKTKYPKPE